MLESDLHDLSDDADYAASVHQGSASVMVTSDSIKRSSSAEPDGAEVVYVKDNVAIHPTQFASERISGRLKLLKQDSCLFMSSNARLSEKDRNLYTITAVPFTEVRSIRRHTPTLGWQYIIVVMSSGLAFPPLYFYNGGVKEFLATIKQHILIVRSLEDANVFLVNDFQNPLQRTLSSLEMPRAVPFASGASASASAGESPSYENQEKMDGGIHSGSSLTPYNVGRQRHKSNDPARDLSIQVLEKFSLVTKFARETTSQLFRENHSNGYGAMDSKNYSYSSSGIPLNTLKDSEEDCAQNPVPSDPLEFDKLTLVWGKPRQSPLGYEEWSTFLDCEGRISDSDALRKRIFYGGVEHSLRREVWPFLLGYHAFDSTYAERECLRHNKKSEYETVKNQWKRGSLVLFKNKISRQGTLCVLSAYQSVHFQMMNKLPRICESISPEQAKRFTKFRERKGLVDKDVVRTDRSESYYDGDDNPNVHILRDILLTYSFYNFDLGYCQGMSDLLSPILFVMEDESESFWCFVALMERLGPNFNRDQSGMHAQLFALSKLVELLDGPLHNYFKQNDCLNYFFCFRWILIQFKREFEYEKTMRLWEVLWTQHLSEHLHLYACVAILKRYRGKIMGGQMDFDTLLKFINELSGHIDLDAILRDAEALCICAGENGAACIPPGTPPSLPLEDNCMLYNLQDDIL